MQWSVRSDFDSQNSSSFLMGGGVHNREKWDYAVIGLEF